MILFYVYNQDISIKTDFVYQYDPNTSPKDKNTSLNHSHKRINRLLFRNCVFEFTIHVECLIKVSENLHVTIFVKHDKESVT